jgi:hypothetical protein
MKLQHPGQVFKRWPHAMSSVDAEGVVNLCKSGEENGKYWDTPHAVVCMTSTSQLRRGTGRGTRRARAKGTSCLAEADGT